MKQLLISILLVVGIITIIVVYFTLKQVDQERETLTLDLQRRTAVLAENLQDNVRPALINGSAPTQNIIDEYTKKEHISGLLVLDNKNNIIASSGSSFNADLSKTVGITSMDEDKADGEFINSNGQKTYAFGVPLSNDKSIIGSLVVVQNAEYIDNTINDIWRTNFLRLVIQIILLSLAIIFIIYWLIYNPISNLVKFTRDIRIGKAQSFPDSFSHSFFNPLIREVTKINKSLLKARQIANYEAKMRVEKVDSPWTAERLKAFSGEILKGRPLFVVSNREPYIHTRKGNQITYFEPASGMVTAIEPIIRACGGTWIAHGSGPADKEVVDSHNKVMVPPDDPKYTLKRVWLTKEEEQGYYEGFSNEGIWPLCHIAHTRPIFRKNDWEQYVKVNGKFAKELLSEIKNVHRPIILIQDYHFAMLPRMIRRSKPDAIIGIFWHIPWPSSESFRICPWRREMLDGMLGANIIGFHTQQYCNNFIDTVGRELEALIDLEQFSVQRFGLVSYIKPFPISIPFAPEKKQIKSERHVEMEKARSIITKELGVNTEFIGVGVDRMDYTKGIIERFRGIDTFFEKYPAYKEKFTFIQVAAPSRSSIIEYSEFAKNVEEESERVNQKYKTRNWRPIVLLEKLHSHEAIETLYKASNICIVTSLHDGMNLVAKEYVAARNDEEGVLILSQFTGASRELKDALIVNPYSAEQIADAMQTGLTMLHAEQRKRMRRLRELVTNYNVYRWSAELLKSLSTVEA